jgi:hypothetical protein
MPTLDIEQVRYVGAVLLGAILQYLFSFKSGGRVFVVILSSSVFMSLFILSPSFDYFELAKDSPIRIISYSLSSLISVEIIAFIISTAPDLVKRKICEYLKVNLDGCPDDNDDERFEQDENK